MDEALGLEVEKDWAMAGSARGVWNGVERGVRRSAVCGLAAIPAVNLRIAIRLSVGEANITG